jgi:hypothetical protein
MDKNKDSRTLVLPSGKIIRVTRTLRTFRQRGIKCVRCKIKGEFFQEHPVIDNEKGMSRLVLIGVRAMNNGLPKYVLMTADHIIPYSKGGMNHLTNLQTMCEKCNCEKQDTLNPNRSIKYSLRSVQEYVLCNFPNSLRIKEFLLDYKSMVKVIGKRNKIRDKDYVL